MVCNNSYPANCLFSFASKKITKKTYKNEHKKQVKVLKTKDSKGIKKENKSQNNELKKIKKK